MIIIMVIKIKYFRMLKNGKKKNKNTVVYANLSFVRNRFCFKIHSKTMKKKMIHDDHVPNELLC